MDSTISTRDDDIAIYLNTLAKHPLFSAFSVDSLTVLVRLGIPKTYHENEVIVKEGELVDGLA